MAKFKLSLKKKPGKQDDPGKWYAIPSVTNRLDTRAVCKVVTRNTTTAPTELESSFNLVCDSIPHELQQGNSVRLGSLGTLRLSFSSEGVANPADFNAGSMIKNVKVIFTPSKELMSAVKEGLSFENAGVVEEGFTYPTLKDYLEYKVTTRGEGGTTTPGGNGGGSGGDGDLGDNPMG